MMPMCRRSSRTQTCSAAARPSRLSAVARELRRAALGFRATFSGLAMEISLTSTATGAAMPGDVEALLAILRSHARSLERDDPEQALRCRSVIGYVENKHRAIANYRIVPLASSGPMEKGVDITICRRFKTRGMSWFRRGVSHLLHLRLMRLNKTWDRHWAERLAAVVRPWPAAA
jgi:hypothetical protein